MALAQSTTVGPSSFAERLLLDEAERRMVGAAVQWLQSHPFSRAVFERYPHPSAILFDEGEKAFSLIRAVLHSVQPHEPSRFDVQVAIGHAFYVLQHGWIAYGIQRERARQGL